MINVSEAAHKNWSTKFAWETEEIGRIDVTFGSKVSTRLLDFSSTILLALDVMN